MLCIAITGFAADPDDITEALAIDPTLVRRGRDGAGRASNGWWLEAHQEPLRSGADHMQGLVTLRAALRGRAARFQTVAGRFAPREMTLYGGLHHRADAPCGVWLDADDMALIAACGLGWSLDLFVDDEPAEGDGLLWPAR